MTQRNEYLATLNFSELESYIKNYEYSLEHSGKDMKVATAMIGNKDTFEYKNNPKKVLKYYNSCKKRLAFSINQLQEAVAERKFRKENGGGFTI